MAKRALIHVTLLAIVLFLGTDHASSVARAEDASPSSAPNDHGWQAVSPRDELRPHFAQTAAGDDDPEPTLVIETDDRIGLQGWWEKSLPVTGGQWYRFTAQRRVSSQQHESGDLLERRSVFVQLNWRDARDKQVNFDRPVVDFYAMGGMKEATPEFPAEVASPEHSQTVNASSRQPSAPAANQWQTVTGCYRAPAGATQAIVELHLQWDSSARVEWRNVSLEPCEEPQGRRVRLATVHYSPKGKSAEENRRLFEPLIADAARQKADLIVLPETVTLQGTGLTYADVAESIPGPSTEFFARLAQQHHVSLVVGLVERDAHLIYNVAVLIGPEGTLLGKYRKVSLPRGEIEAGVMPGDEYPVFEAPFGKVGLMVCYDGFFPEVARELANRGAEVIAFPVAGCNPQLVSARACENHVYIVSSCYTDVAQNWTVSGIYDHQGQLLAQAKQWGTIAISEVDLDQPTRWANLGDFKAQLPRHRPRGMSD